MCTRKVVMSNGQKPAKASQMPEVAMQETSGTGDMLASFSMEAP